MYRFRNANAAENPNIFARLANGIQNDRCLL